MPGKLSFDDTGDFGMPPNAIPSQHGTPTTSGGKDAGGTPNLRSDGGLKGPVTGTPGGGDNRNSKFPRVKFFSDEEV
jgi:hypothetical protein